MALRLLVAALLLSHLHSCIMAYQDSGERYLTLWPPLNADTYTSGTSTVLVNAATFAFVDLSPCPASQIPTAIAIYQNVLFKAGPPTPAGAAALSALHITALDSSLHPPDVFPDETYTLTIPAMNAPDQVATLTANTYIGVLRGLETFSQLVLYSVVAGAGPIPQYNIPQAPWNISEAPHFSHRGALIDPPRTFLPVADIKRVIDGLLWSKMNVLHWRLTDSQSFTFQSVRRPNVTFFGAFSADQVYSVADIQAVVQYATERGVRVIPETDTPGHARAYGLDPAVAETIACGGVTGDNWGSFCAEPPCGQLNPASSLMYTVMSDVFQDINDLFPDTTLHVGYDEINFACWASNAAIQAYMKEHGLNNHTLLLEFFTKQQAMMQEMNASKIPTYWEEAALQTPRLPLRPDDVIQVWSDVDALQTILNFTESDIIVSWYHNVYLDCGGGNMFGNNTWCDPMNTWLHIYATDPLAGFYDKDKTRARGGEACLWGEMADKHVLDGKMWPRAAAYGARLWTYDNPVNDREASLAIMGHAARLTLRGINASPAGMYFCSLYPDMCYPSNP